MNTCEVCEGLLVPQTVIDGYTPIKMQSCIMCGRKYNIAKVFKFFPRENKARKKTFTVLPSERQEKILTALKVWMKERGFSLKEAEKELGYAPYGLQRLVHQGRATRVLEEKLRKVFPEGFKGASLTVLQFVEKYKLSKACVTQLLRQGVLEGRKERGRWEIVDLYPEEHPLTGKEAAEYYNVTTRTIRFWLQEGSILGWKIGSRWRVFKERGENE